MMITMDKIYIIHSSCLMMMMINIMIIMIFNNICMKSFGYFDYGNCVW